MKFRASFILFLSFLFSFSSTALPQQTDTKSENSLPRSTFYFYIINDYALAYKFYNSGNSDFKIQLDLSSTYSDGRQNSEYQYLPTGTKDKTENNSTESFNYISAAFAYSYNFYRSVLGQAYAGIGPFVSYNRSKSESEGKRNYQGALRNSKYSYSTNGLSGGLMGFIGIESFITTSVRVFAETQLTGGKSWGNGENQQDSLSPDGTSGSKYVNKDDSSVWFYNIKSIRIGLGISL